MDNRLKNFVANEKLTAEAISVLKGKELDRPAGNWLITGVEGVSYYDMANYLTSYVNDIDDFKVDGDKLQLRPEITIYYTNKATGVNSLSVLDETKPYFRNSALYKDKQVKALFNSLSKHITAEYEKEVARDAKAAELKKAAEQAELDELRRQKRIARELAKVGKLEAKAAKGLFDSTTRYYTALGWAAKHIVSIKPAMPDYLESWFVGRFGDVDRRVVDSKKKYGSGFPSQWGFSIDIRFDQLVPSAFRDNIKARRGDKHVICNLDFALDLIENYGFKFANPQDLDEIKSRIPVEHLDDFEYGYNEVNE